MAGSSNQCHRHMVLCPQHRTFSRHGPQCAALISKIAVLRPVYERRQLLKSDRLARGLQQLQQPGCIASLTG